MELVIGNKYTRTLTIVLLVCVMCIIFALSCENADDSTDTSASLIDYFAKALGIEQYSDAYWSLTTLVRKLAHFSEFAFLGALAFLTTAHFKIKLCQKLMFSAIFSVLYATSDEIHQYFVPGRACRFTDVCIDSAGALFGMSVTLLIIYIILRRKNNETVTIR